MLKLKKIGILFMVAVLAAAFTSCSNSGNKKETKSAQKKVSILYPNWAEGIAFTYLAKAALEGHNYEVELTNLEPGLIYGELSKTNSKGDVFLDAWLPNTHKDYWADYGNDLVKLGEAFSGGTTGLVVPSYLTINSIEELNANKDKFNEEIIGIGSGAGIHANTIKAIEEYNLDLEQVTSSGPAMVASLEKAIKNEEWIVVTGWKPHYMWANYDLKYLTDPKGVYPQDVCAIISRKGFEQDTPEAAKFFRNFNLEEAQLYDLMAEIKANDEETGAQKWYEANKEFVDSWFE
ncbi:glycine betaine ABC transporter substrate-binding protein [Maribellus maritimus]|uniref:glycine betaine ABC transporter substrate-binding protein n=1 Tax=Maribellus maritimus TaxID=2870838 RepID=UPI001EEC154C|nr:glycine betaine ABC transporter substrate-binding protein [Maribellus maritimus]MCG6187479.1 glycine betaine ABC transporter substrate-binding protein [Maribellus maritimus]